MHPKGFNITFETVTPESAENGEPEASGFLLEDITLREAHIRLRFEGFAESADCDPGVPRWLTFGESENYQTGERTTLSLHFPRSITDASALRVARLFGWKSERCKA